MKPIKNKKIENSLKNKDYYTVIQCVENGANLTLRQISKLLEILKNEHCIGLAIYIFKILDKAQIKELLTNYYEDFLDYLYSKTIKEYFDLLFIVAKERHDSFQLLLIIASDMEILEVNGLVEKGFFKDEMAMIAEYVYNDALSDNPRVTYEELEDFLSIKGMPKFQFDATTYSDYELKYLWAKRACDKNETISIVREALNGTPTTEFIENFLKRLLISDGYFASGIFDEVIFEAVLALENKETKSKSLLILIDMYYNYKSPQNLKLIMEKLINELLKINIYSDILILMEILPEENQKIYIKSALENRDSKLILTLASTTTNNLTYNLINYLVNEGDFMRLLTLVSRLNKKFLDYALKEIECSLGREYCKKIIKALFIMGSKNIGDVLIYSLQNNYFDSLDLKEKYTRERTK